MKAPPKDIYGGGPTKILGHKNRMVIDRSGRCVNLIDIIAGMIMSVAEVFLDAFAGTHSVSHRVKCMGLRVIANDLRKSSFYCGKALIESSGYRLEESEVERMLSEGSDRGPVRDLLVAPLGEANAIGFNRIVDSARKTFAAGPGMESVCAFYGVIHVIMQELNNYHLHQGNQGRLSGNEHLANRDLVASWRHWIICDLPKLVFDNGQLNEARNEDAVQLIPKIHACACYIDSPYPSGSDYVSDFRLLEDLCEVYETGAAPSGSRNRSAHRFHTRSSYLASMTHLLLAGRHIPQWIISINTSSAISPEELRALVEATGRTCDIHPYEVPLRTRIPGSGNKRNFECLLDCRQADASNITTEEIRKRLDCAARDMGGDNRQAIRQLREELSL